MKRDATMEAAVAQASATALPATIKMWTYLSKHHIQAAARFARLSASLERAHKGKSSPNLFVEHRAYVLGSVLTAVAFLEATINELFAKAADGRLDGLSPEATAGLAERWVKPRTARLPICRKYQIALTSARRQPFKPGTAPYHDVDLLMQLRNALVHYKPEWVIAASGADQKRDTIKKWQKRLQGKFAVNPLTAKGNPFYPDKCLSHGCAKWAVESSLKFTDDFFSRMGLKPPYTDVRADLATE